MPNEINQDFSQYSNEELFKMAGVGSPTSAISTLPTDQSFDYTNEELFKIAGVQPKPEPSFLPELGSAVLRGFTAKPLEVVGQAIQAFDRPGGIDIARDIGGGFETLGTEIEKIPGFRVGDISKLSYPARSVVQAAESVPTSLTASALGGGAGAAVGGGVPGAIAGFAAGPTILFSLAAKEEARRKYTKEFPHLRPEEIDWFSTKEGLYEGVPELIGGLITAYTLGVGAPAAQIGKQAAKTIIKDIMSVSLGHAIKQVAKTIPVEVGTELVTALGKRGVEQEAGLSTPSVSETIYETFGPAFVSSILFGVGAEGMNSLQHKRYRSILSNKDADIESRKLLAGQITNNLKKHDPELASIWKDYSSEAIDAKAPIPIELNVKILQENLKRTAQQVSEANEAAQANIKELAVKIGKGERDFTEEEQTLYRNYTTEVEDTMKDMGIVSPESFPFAPGTMEEVTTESFEPTIIPPTREIGEPPMVAPLGEGELFETLKTPREAAAIEEQLPVVGIPQEPLPVEEATPLQKAVGKIYTTAREATSAIKMLTETREDQDNWETIKRYEDQPILTKAGKPFVTEKQAVNALNMKGLPKEDYNIVKTPDGKGWEIQEQGKDYHTGWEIRRKEGAPALPVSEKQVDRRLEKLKPQVSGRRAYDFSPSEAIAQQAVLNRTATPEQIKIVEGREIRIEADVARQMGEKWLASKSKEDQPPSFLRTVLGKLSGTVQRQVQSHLNNVSNKMLNNRIFPVQSLIDLPQHLQDYIATQERSEEIMAVFDPKTKNIYIVSDNVTSQQDIDRAIVHEITHLGLRDWLGLNELKPIFNQVSIKYSAAVERIATQYGFDLKTENGRYRAAEEVLASLPDTLDNRNIIEKLYQVVRRWLLSHGFDIKLSDNELSGLVQEARKYVRDGRVSEKNNENVGPALFARTLNSPGIPTVLIGEEPSAALQEHVKRWFGPDAKVDKLGALTGADPTHEKFELRGEMYDIKRQLKDILEVVSSRLEKISPPIYNALYKIWIQEKMIKASRDESQVEPFVTVFNNMPQIERETMKEAMLNDAKDIAIEIARKNNIPIDIIEKGYAVRDRLGKDALEAGFSFSIIEGSWPRFIQDYDGFLNEVYKTTNPSIIQEAIKSFAESKGKDEGSLTDVERSMVIDLLLRGYPVDKISLSKPSPLMSRTIKKIPPNLLKFYAMPDVSIIAYIKKMHDAIAMAKFFGKHKRVDKIADDVISDDDLKKSVGDYALESIKNGELHPADEPILKDLLQGVFHPTQATWGTRAFKNITYMQTLMQFLPSLSQIVDIGLSSYKIGTKYSLKGLLEESPISLQDVGIKRPLEEIEYGKLDKMGNVLNWMFKWSGFNAMDKMGKMTLLNGRLFQMADQAKQRDSKLITEITTMLGADKVEATINDLINQNYKTDDILYMLVRRVAETQPITALEMPLKYHQMNFGKTFYTLKTYQVKLLNLLKKDIFDNITKGAVKKDYKRVSEGISNLAKLSISLYLLGVGTDWLKGWMMGKDDDLDDLAVDNMFRLVGMSKYTAFRFKEGIGAGVIAQLAPPVASLNSLPRDFLEYWKNGELAKGARSTQFFPMGGKLYYWWFGRGKEIVREEAYKKAIEERIKKTVGEGKYKQYLEHLEEKNKRERTKQKIRREYAIKQFEKYGLNR